MVQEIGENWLTTHNKNLQYFLQFDIQCIYLQ